ncbi:hypothetical protein [Prevotella sp.]|jgi:hypothetical protein|uniref:hypothetical protein n=1 Tax=Prevotella sp. TaxID=59823 RepID=UPI003F7F2F5B
MITLHYIDFNGEEERLKRLVSPSCICSIEPILDEESEHHSILTLKNGSSFTVVETIEEIKNLMKFETL